MKRVIGIDPAYVDCIIELPANLSEKMLRQLEGDSESLLKLRRLNEWQQTYPSTMLPGGTICNMLANVAAIGGRAGLIALIGNDDAGKIAQENLAQRNIDLLVAPQDGCSSPVMYAIRKNVDDTYYKPYNGDALSLKPQHMPADVDSKDSIIVMQLPRMLSFGESIEKYLHSEQRGGAKIALGLQRVEEENDLTPGDIQYYMRSANYVFGNRAEFQKAFDTESPIEAAINFSHENEMLLVMTDGANGLFGFDYGAVWNVRAELPAEQVKCTIGAGDAVMGGTLYGLANGWQPKAATQLGAVAAAHILQQEGGQPPVRTHGNLQSLVSRALPGL